MSAPTWLGLDVGGTKLLATLVGDDLRVQRTARCATERDAGPEHVLERAARLVREVAVGAAPGGLGIGFAGLVDGARGVVRSSIMLPGFDDVPIAGHLGAALDLPVVVDNDANAAGFGELLAMGRPRDLHMVVLTVGTGIGGAVIVNGDMYRGATGLAGEFGNTTLDWQGETCWCGSRGCANMLASGSALAARARALGVPAPHARLTAEEVVARAAAGDAAAREAVEAVAVALGALVANIVNVFNPHRVAIAGGLAALDDGFFDAVRRSAAARAFAEALAATRIERALLGEAAGAVGAAGLARVRFAARSLP